MKNRTTILYGYIRDFMSKNGGEGDLFAACHPDNVPRVREILETAQVAAHFTIQPTTLMAPDTLTLYVRKEIKVYL